MSFKAKLVFDLTKEEELLLFAPRPPLLSSHYANWESIHLMYSRQPAHEVPECCLAQHILAIHTGVSPVRLSVEPERKYLLSNAHNICSAVQAKIIINALRQAPINTMRLVTTFY